ncbi:MAG: hypothetical protein ACFFBD_12210 [Candidatus Hodarchaeota archaeon]
MSKKTSFEALDLIEIQREEGSKHWKLLFVVRGGQDKQQTRRFSSDIATEIVFHSEKLQVKLDLDGKVIIRPEDPKSYKINVDMMECIGEEATKKAQIKTVPL